MLTARSRTIDTRLELARKQLVSSEALILMRQYRRESARPMHAFLAMRPACCMHKLLASNVGCQPLNVNLL